jgi:formate dehydrogenase major subunit
VGVVPERPVSPRTAEIRSRREGANGAVSVRPYCNVGGSQRVCHKDGKVLRIEGNYESFINGSTRVSP